ncbi:MAG: alpha/beta hydrolase family protein [Myxococcota bacterium]
MQEMPRFPAESLIPVLGGLVWLLAGAGSGFFGFLFSVLPGSLLLAGGVAAILLPGDERTPQLAALGGALGLVLALPLVLAVGPGLAALLLVLSAVGFVSSGRTSHRFAELPQEAEDSGVSPRLALELALDEVNLATIPLGRRSPLGPSPEQIRDEVEAVRAFFDEQGWLEKPFNYHLDPPPLRAPRLEPVTSRGLRYEHLSFESEYAPRNGEPGRDRWLGYAANRTAHAWVLRHPGEPRPWLVCLHGFGMGIPVADLPAFRARELHEKRGLNLLLPVLPLHGPRKEGLRAGDLFLGGAFLNAIHAEAQAAWDVRRLLGWMCDEQEAPRIGLAGLSLGGYTAALIAALEAKLACVIAGIPATDLTALTRRIDSPHALRRLVATETTWRSIEAVLRVISPLTMPARVPHGARYIFGGRHDRIVPPDQVQALWEHWERPRIVWYDGGHVSFHWKPEVRRLIDDALRESGMGDAR